MGLTVMNRRPNYWRQHFHLIGLALLAPMFVCIFYVDFWLRFEGQLNEATLQQLQDTVGWFVCAKLAWFAAFRTCKGWRRSVTFYDLTILLQSTTGSVAVAAILQYCMIPTAGIPRSIFLIDWGATLVVLGGSRALVRLLREANWNWASSPNQVRVLIAGAGEMGVAMLRMLRRSNHPHYQVVGFTDQNPELLGVRIEGIPVLGNCHHIPQLIKRHRIRQLLVMQGEIPGQQLRALIDGAQRNGCEVRVMPNYRQVLDGNITIQPRPVSIEDLLQREPVQLDIQNIRQWIDDRVILVTGSAGSIGSEICRQLLQFSPKRVVMVDRSETAQFFLERELQLLANGKEIDVCIADVLDEHRMRQIMTQHRPHVIFHAAAYKHVPLMESHPQEAVRNIVTATRKLADLAMEFAVESLVMISTDKAVNPMSMMGACKRTAELYVQSLAGRSATRFVTVRFGNVLDSAGSVVPLFRQQIASGGPVTVTDPNIRRYFMTIPEASRLVIEAGVIGQSGQILLLDMGEPVRIVDLAADMIRLSGLRVGDDIAIEFVGLRPGEKLFEELHLPGEKLVATSHPKIIVAEHRSTSHQDLDAKITQLEQTARNAPDVVADLLEEIVFESRRSKRLHKSRQRGAA